MITISCPWCDEDAPMAFSQLDEPTTVFRCPDCGTSVAIVDDMTLDLDLAA